MMNEVLRDYRLRSLTVCQVRLTFEGWHSSATGSPKGQVGNRSSSGLSGKPLTSSLGAFLTFTKGKRNAKSSFTKINGKLRGNGIKEQESAKCDAFSTGHLLILTCDRILLLQDMGGEGDGKDQHPYENDGEPRRYAPLSSDPNDIFLSISLSQILQVEICEDGCGVDIEYMNPSPKYQKSSSTLLDETDSDNDQASEYSFPSPERFPLLSALVSGGRGALKRKLGSLSGRAPTSMRGASSLEGGIVRILLHTKNSQTAINLKNAIQTTCKRFLEALLWLDRGLPTTVDSVLGVTTVSAEYGSQSNGKGIVLGRGFAWGETLRISGEPVCIHIDLSTPLGPRSCDFCCRGEEKALKNGVHRVQTMQTNSGTVKNGKEQLDVYVTIELAYLKQSPIGAASLDRRRVKTKREFTPWGWKPEGEILLFALSVFVCCTATLFIRTTSGSWLIVTILGINMVLSCLRIVSWWVRPHLAHLPIARTLHESDGYEEPAHTEAQFTRLGQCVGTCLSLKFVRAEIIEDVHKSHELAEPPSYDFSADLHGRISLEIDDEMPPIARKLSRTMSLQKTLVMVNDDVPRVDVDGGLIDVGAMAASQRLVVSSPHSQSFTTPNTSHGVFNLGESNDNHMKRDIQMQHMFGTLEFSPQSTKQLDGLDGPHLHDDKVSEVQEETACASNFSQTIAELAVISPYITDDLFERYLFACEGDSEMALNRLRATAVSCVFCCLYVYIP